MVPEPSFAGQVPISQFSFREMPVHSSEYPARTKGMLIPKIKGTSLIGCILAMMSRLSHFCDEVMCSLKGERDCRKSSVLGMFLYCHFFIC